MENAKDEQSDINWDKPHIFYIANEIDYPDSPDPKVLRSKIEPWLTAVFQSEHLSLLVGSGLTTGVCHEAGVKKTQAMGRIEFKTEKEAIQNYATQEATNMVRGKPNFEDDLRAAIELLKGLKILNHEKAKALEDEINEQLKTLIINLLNNESIFLKSDKKVEVLSLLKRFLISFASRTATRDRLHIFTTNYDRFIEYALDEAGIYTLDRFIGKLRPILRMHKMELDYHYNPPGIRGEPRYVEGVVRYTKLHGSLDWRFERGEIYKTPLPFGTELQNDEWTNPYETRVIYPNASKGIDTAYFPYSELFRDFSTAICRPNSVLVTYGYGFGDSHINAMIRDMLTIPSTHLVIISFDQAGGRIPQFVNQCNGSQLTFLIGSHFGHLRTLTEHYLPKSAIDRISERRQKIMEKRGVNQNQKLSAGADDESGI